MQMANTCDVQRVQLPLQKVLRELRRALPAEGLAVVEEIELQSDPRAVLLLVDCPLLFFEAVALDRCAGVFFPLHVVVSGDETGTSIRWAHPSTSGSRLPATVKDPLNALHQRLTDLLTHPRWQKLRG